MLLKIRSVWSEKQLSMLCTSSESWMNILACDTCITIQILVYDTVYSITTYWFVIHSEKYIRKTNKSICIRNTLFWGLFHLTGSDRVQNAKELMLGHQSYFDTLTVNQMPQLRIWLELTLSSHYNCPLLFTSLIS